jgi:hypothetical protein
MVKELRIQLFQAAELLVLSINQPLAAHTLFLSHVLILGADLDGLDNHAVDLAPGTAAAGASTAAAGAGTTTAAAAVAATAAAAAAVREAIKTHASQIHIKDIKWGGTLLHWATEKPTMEAFIGRGEPHCCIWIWIRIL